MIFEPAKIIYSSFPFLCNNILAWGCNYSAVHVHYIYDKIMSLVVIVQSVARRRTTSVHTHFNGTVAEIVLVREVSLASRTLLLASKTVREV